MEMFIQESGIMTEQMVMVYISMLMEQDMKVKSINLISLKEKAFYITLI